MTCVVGLIEDGRIWMGADSCISSAINRTLGSPKVFTLGAYIIGFSGSMRELQLWQFKATLPDPPQSTSLDHFMAGSFADAIRSCLSESGQMGKDDEREGSTSQALVGVRGRLYRFQQDFSAVRPRPPYDAAGSGCESALGALHALNPYDIAPKQKVLAALKASAEFTAYVAPPFHIRSMEISK